MEVDFLINDVSFSKPQPDGWNEVGYCNLEADPGDNRGCKFIQ